MTNLMTEAEQRWHAIETCNVQAAGKFVYRRKSESIYCSPICRKRPREAGDVELFDTAANARSHGYTPCPDCYPDQDGWLIGAARWM